MGIFAKTGHNGATGTRIYAKESDFDAVKKLFVRKPYRNDPAGLEEWIETVKEKQQKHFIATESDRKAVYFTEVQNVSLLIADLDGVGKVEDFENSLKANFKDTKYFAYETLNNGIKEPEKGLRCRLVIELDRPMDEDENEKAMYRLAELLNVEIDPLNIGLHSLKGAPIDRHEDPEQFWTIENDGKPEKVDHFIAGVELPKVTRIDLPSEYCGHKHDLSEYDGRFAQWLNDTENSQAWASLRTHVRFWLRQEMISMDDARTLMIASAYGNAKWEAEALANLKPSRMPRNYGGCPIQFFGDGGCWTLNNPEHPAEEAEPANEPAQEMPDEEAIKTALDKMKNDLANKMKQWQSKHTEPKLDKKGKPILDADGNPIMITRYPSPITMVDLLKEVVPMIRLAQSGNTKKLPLAWYNPSTGLYTIDEDGFFQLVKAMDRGVEPKFANEVMWHARLEAPIKKQTTDPHYSVLKNGIFDRRTRALMPFTPNLIFINKIDTRYVPNAPEPVFIKQDGTEWRFSEWLDHLCQHPDKKIEELNKKFWWQVFAQLCLTNEVAGKSIWLFSKAGETGKSTMQDVMTLIVGEENWFEARLSKFEDKFEIAGAFGKSLIIGDDNHSKDFLRKNENFKSIVTGEIVGINDKNEKKFSARINALVIQSMNNTPRFESPDKGLMRRIEVFEFTPIPEDQKDDWIKSRFIKDPALHEFIVSKALNIDDIKIISLPQSERIKKNIVEDSMPLVVFLQDVLPLFKSNRIPLSFLFDVFEKWSIEIHKRQTQLNFKTFREQVADHCQKYGWEALDDRQKTGLSYQNQEDEHVINTMLGEHVEAYIYQARKAFDKYAKQQDYVIHRIGTKGSTKA